MQSSIRAGAWAWLLALALAGCGAPAPDQAARSGGEAAPAAPPAEAPDLPTPTPPPPPVDPVPEVLPDVVARVNATEITAAELERAVRSAEIQAGQPLPPQFRDQVYRSILDQLVAFHLLLQESEARDLTVDEATLEAQIAEMRASFPDEEAFTAQLESWETNREELREETRRDLQVQRLIDAAVVAGIEIDAASARAFYDEHPDQFTRPGGVEARHLLIGVSPNASEADKAAARERAAALRQQVLDGADFAELARTASEDPGSAENGGDLGVIVPGQTVPAFEAALFALEAGGLSEVVETPFGFHVIQMVGQQEPQLVSFEDTSVQIREFLAMQEQQAQTEAFLESLRARSTIEILM